MNFTVFWEKFQVFSGTYVLLFPCATVKMETIISFEILVVLLSVYGSLFPDYNKIRSYNLKVF
jgi:hypothetical protein